MIEPNRRLLWTANTSAINKTTFLLADNINNYEEVHIYGSAARENNGYVSVVSEFPVVSHKQILVGPYNNGIFSTNKDYFGCNASQVYLNENSGWCISSVYMGMQYGSTAWNASNQVNRAVDIRPYKIVGVNYPSNYDRTLLWSANKVNLYNNNITLNDSITNYEEIVVYASGFRSNPNGYWTKCSKNVYPTTTGVMGCDAYTYTPWGSATPQNIMLGCELQLNNNSGHIGSAYFFGTTTGIAYDAGKWDSYTPSALQPYKIYGIKKKT